LVKVDNTKRGMLSEACHFHGVIVGKGKDDNSKVVVVTVGKEQSGFTKDQKTLRRIKDSNNARVEMAKSRIIAAIEQSGVSPLSESIA
jgi:hypothetical protein